MGAEKTIADSAAQVGREVDKRGIAPELIERWALHYLSRYSSSSENLRRVLMRRARKFSAEATPEAAELIDALVARYRQSGLIDDTSYAAARVQSLYRRGESMRGIRARLTAKGVAPADAVEAVSGLLAAAPDPDLAAACTLARRRRLGPYRRSAVDHNRELAVFARAGFSRRIAEAVLACADIEAVEALARDGLD